MKMVNTVLGPVSSDELGLTLMHEHFFWGLTGYFVDETVAPFAPEEAVNTALADMEELKTYGVKTIVDATSNEGGRDPGLLREIAEKSGMNIICSTGLYEEHGGAAPYFRTRSTFPIFDVIAEIEELFVKEITEGIGKTGVKAGVIKVGTGSGSISEYEERVLKAAARAQKATGVPIITHTEDGTMGPEQVDIFLAGGAEPKQIMIGHCGGSGDVKYHTAILDKGVYIAFDRLGGDMPGKHLDRWRLASIIGLIGIGHAERLIMSHDYVMKLRGRPIPTALMMPNWHWRHIFKDIIPALKKAGIADDTINMIMVENPRRLFAGD